MSTPELAETLAQERRLHQEREAAAAALAAPPSASDWADMGPLERLAVMHRGRVEILAEVDGDIAAEVTEARRAGLSWHAIGRALEVTGEGARKRWG